MSTFPDAQPNIYLPTDDLEGESKLPFYTGPEAGDLEVQEQLQHFRIFYNFLASGQLVAANPDTTAINYDAEIQTVMIEDLSDKPLYARRYLRITCETDWDQWLYTRIRIEHASLGQQTKTAVDNYELQTRQLYELKEDGTATSQLTSCDFIGRTSILETNKPWENELPRDPSQALSLLDYADLQDLYAHYTELMQEPKAASAGRSLLDLLRRRKRS